MMIAFWLLEPYWVTYKGVDKMKPERHIWEEDSTHRMVDGEYYDAVWDYAEQLDAENEGLRWKAQAVVDAATGGQFDKFSGHDDYVISYQLIDELADALLAGAEDD